MLFPLAPCSDRRAWHIVLSLLTEWWLIEVQRQIWGHIKSVGSRSRKRKNVLEGKLLCRKWTELVRCELQTFVKWPVFSLCFGQPCRRLADRRSGLREQQAPTYSLIREHLLSASGGHSSWEHFRDATAWQLPRRRAVWYKQAADFFLSQSSER